MEYSLAYASYHGIFLGIMLPSIECSLARASEHRHPPLVKTNFAQDILYYFNVLKDREPVNRPVQPVEPVEPWTGQLTGSLTGPSLKTLVLSGRAGCFVLLLFLVLLGFSSFCPYLVSLLNRVLLEVKFQYFVSCVAVLLISKKKKFLLSYICCCRDFRYCPALFLLPKLFCPLNSWFLWTVCTSFSCS